MYAPPHNVEENIQHFLDSFRTACTNSPVCTINNNDSSATYLKSPTEQIQNRLLNDHVYPYPYTRGSSGSYYYDNGMNCWRFSWSNLSETSTSPGCMSPYGSVSEASSAIGSFENPSWSHNNAFWDYVMGESACSLTVLDVADALQSGYAYISGGKGPDGHPIITFSDHHELGELTDEEYKNVVTYLTSIPPLHDVDLGFVVVVDKRHDKWSAVKTLLHRISGFFPGLVQEVLVLRPNGFFQRTFTDMGFKFVKDDFKFQVAMFSSLEELHAHVGRDQLTEDLGGTLSYNHQEWIQHRAAIEKFSASTSQIGQRLRDVCKILQLTEFPNDVASTETLISDHEQKRSELKDDLSMTIKHGEILLGCIKTVRGEDGQEVELASSDLPCNKLAHITAVERLLVQLEETLQNFDDFWQHHEHKLCQCLQLRQFEERFRQVAALIESHITLLCEQNDLGDSTEGVTRLVDELHQFEADTMDDIHQAEALFQEGERFIEDDHYAVDCIRPKCLELQRICEQYKELLRKRQELLAQSKTLQDRIQRANQWCTKGIDLMSSQCVDQNSPQEGVHAALRDIEAFLSAEDDLGLSDPNQVKVIFDDIITPELKVALEQVLQRMDDVGKMCDQKRHSLKKIVDRPPRPIQTVYPEPQQQSIMQRHRHASEDFNRDNKERNSGRGQLERSKTEVQVIHPEWDLTHMPKALDSDSDSGSPKDQEKMDTLQAKRRRKRKMQRHVMRELIETEKFYVSELKTILEGYYDQMENPELEELLPPALVNQKQVIFGNLHQICQFHESVFLKDLEACRETPSMVGQCFVSRNEEFKLYSDYCQNKIASDELRQDVGENNPFFQECQNRCGHKLPLGAYLLKPVQRMTKYHLLLKEMLKYTQTDLAVEALEEAVQSMMDVIKYVNDIMHQVAITGYDQEKLDAAGRLLMQGSFSVWRDNKRIAIRDLRFKAMQRHIFLYEKIILFCKRKEEPDRGDKSSYIFKHSLQTSQIGMTETVRGDKKKFEIWLHGRTEVYTIQAPSIDVKNIWITQIKKVLLGQFDHIKEKVKKTKTSPGAQAPVHERVLESSQSVSLNTSAPHSGHQGSADNNNYQSPSGMRKSYSTDSYTSPAALPKSYSTEGTLVSEPPISPETATDLQIEVEEDNWSTDEEDNSGNGCHDDQVHHGTMHALEFQDIIYTQRYVALATYEASETSEATIQEGDMCEVLQIGSKGWWFVRNLASLEEGWAPASFLDCAKRSSTYSAQSTLSSGSTGKIQEEDETTA